jgi:hypothetical protein
MARPADEPTQEHEGKPTLWLRPPPSSEPGGLQPPAPPGSYIGAPRPPAPAQPRAPVADPPASGNGRAISSLVLGITGLTLWLTSLGVLAVVSLPCSALAWFLGVGARRRIAAQETERGLGAARTGVITGVVGVVLGVLAIAFWALVIAYGD